MSKLLAAIYLRVSTEEQAEQGISIPSQKDRGLAYCKSKDWNLYDFYIDDGKSGKDLERPEMQRLINDAKSKKFDVVLVVKLDRLSRRQRDVMYLIEDIFMANDIEFASVTENIDTNTPMGRAMVGIMAVFAQLERETIIERVTDSKREAAKQGRWMGGPRRYGYNHNPATKSIVINELEANVIRFIYDEYLKGDKGYKAIAEILNNKKIPTPAKSKSWYVTTVRAILKNPHYAGYTLHKGKLYQGKHESIITIEQWEDAQKIHANRNKFNVDNSDGLLKGLVVCGECGAGVRSKQVGRSNGKSEYYYMCYSRDKGAPNMIKDPNCQCKSCRVDKLDNIIIEKLFHYSLNRKDLERAAKNQLAPVDKDNIKTLLDQAQKEYNDIKRKINKWQDAYEVDAISAQDLRERTETLKDRRLYLDTLISDYKQELNDTSEEDSYNKLLELMSNFKDNWEEATDEERREILLTIVKQVKIYKDKAPDIDFYL